MLARLLPGQGFRHHALRRNAVGHFVLVGRLGNETIDILIDTGASNTILDLEWARSRGIPLVDTGRRGGGAGSAEMPIYALGDVPLALDGLPVRSDGIFALDMSHVNRGLAMKGAGPVTAVIGADVLSRHDAVIDYATASLYLRHPGATS